MINRIRDVRKAKRMTLADVAAACKPPTTAQTIGRLETGTRTLSLGWMRRIAKALDVAPTALVRGEDNPAPQVVATLGQNGPEPLKSPREAVVGLDTGGAAPLMVMTIDYPHGEYRPGDQLWLRQLEPGAGARAINRDVLLPRSAGRFAFGRLVDRDGTRFALLPPGHGEKQIVVDKPAWVAVAETLVRRL